MVEHYHANLFKDALPFGCDGRETASSEITPTSGLLPLVLLSPSLYLSHLPYYLLGVFLALGLSGVIPTLHFVISEGLLKAATMGQIGWLALMACLYITGAALYAARIPERFFPGKCDIWFHSHQLFHVFVVAGAFVHFHGVSNLQEFRFMVGGGCSEDEM